MQRLIVVLVPHHTPILFFNPITQLAGDGGRGHILLGAIPVSLSAQRFDLVNKAGGGHSAIAFASLSWLGEYTGLI